MNVWQFWIHEETNVCVICFSFTLMQPKGETAREPIGEKRSALPDSDAIIGYQRYKRQITQPKRADLPPRHQKTGYPTSLRETFHNLSGLSFCLFGGAEHFVQRGNAASDFANAVVPQRAHSAGDRRSANFLGRGPLERQFANLGIHQH